MLSPAIWTKDLILFHMEKTASSELKLQKWFLESPTSYLSNQLLPGFPVLVISENKP